MTLPTAGLRSDSRQWLIYDDETLGALMRGLEVMALSMVGQTLLKNRLMQIRALGGLMLRVGETRAAEMLKAGGAQGVIIGHLARVMNWLAGAAPEPEIGVLEDLHAAAFRLDSRARGAGMTGPGTHRLAIRGD